MSWSPSSPGSQGLSPAGHRPALPGLPCCPLGRFRPLSSWQVYREETLLLCLEYFWFYLYAGWLLKLGFLIRILEYVCLLSVNSSVLLAPVVIFVIYLSCSCPLRVLQNHLSLLAPGEPWGALVGLCMYGAGCLVATCDLDAFNSEKIWRTRMCFACARAYGVGHPQTVG